jgi:hypothetical protein
MSGQLQLPATLTATPSMCGGSFPSGITQIPFGLNPPSKPYTVSTGAMVATVDSPSSFVALGGIGAGGAVTQATTLYLRTTAPIALQLIRNNNGSGTTTITLGQVSGVFLLEAPAGYEVQSVLVEGAGTVEYFAAGND